MKKTNDEKLFDLQIKLRQILWRRLFYRRILHHYRVKYHSTIGMKDEQLVELLINL